GNKEDPRSLHKYVYAFNDPLDNVDPSGNIPIVSNLLYGNRVHRFIYANFIATGLGAPRVTDQSISAILGIPYVPLLTAGRPDLVQFPLLGSPGEVYEIKPVGSFIEGQVQLQWYLTVLNALDPARRTWSA